MSYLCIIVLEFSKTIVTFKINTLKVVKIEFFNSVNFGRESGFSKGLGSTFSEGQIPGLDLLCKVCPKNFSCKHEIHLI